MNHGVTQSGVSTVVRRQLCIELLPRNHATTQPLTMPLVPLHDPSLHHPTPISTFHLTSPPTQPKQPNFPFLFHCILVASVEQLLGISQTRPHILQIMSIELEKILAAAPATTRGQPTQLSCDPKGERIAYAVSTRSTPRRRLPPSV